MNGLCYDFLLNEFGQLQLSPGIHQCVAAVAIVLSACAVITGSIARVLANWKYMELENCEKCIYSINNVE